MSPAKSVTSSTVGREAVRRGINGEGHAYTRYSDGAYSYRNVDAATGRLVSVYYNTGKGHAFYRNAEHGYGFHENIRLKVRHYYGRPRVANEVW